MQILKKDAEEIVSELSKLVDLKINIIGSDCIIIANSDPSRVGNFHEATKKIVEEQLDELVVYRDTDYQGTRSGTNLPISINGTIVGVVGVTGPYDVAKAYGKIIQKMTEIMLQSRAAEWRRIQQAQEQERYLIDWICNETTILNENFIRFGKQYQLDIIDPRRVIVVLNASAEEHVLDSIRTTAQTHNKKNIVFATIDSIVVLMYGTQETEVVALANQLHQTLQTGGCDAYLGVDGGCGGFSQIHEQYRQAKKMVDIAWRQKHDPILLHSQSALALVLDEISISAKLRYVKQIFGSASRNEIDRDIRCMAVLYEEDGSIKRAAERLIIHPNTLQYQLKKIETKTGLDPRKLKDAVVFQVAAMFARELVSHSDEISAHSAPPFHSQPPHTD